MRIPKMHTRHGARQRQIRCGDRVLVLGVRLNELGRFGRLHRCDSGGDDSGDYHMPRGTSDS